jgi:hypothetical protein
MRNKPDTTIHVDQPIMLTSYELGEAFANRGDDEQANILRAIVKGFDNY